MHGATLLEILPMQLSVKNNEPRTKFMGSYKKKRVFRAAILEN